MVATDMHLVLDFQKMSKIFFTDPQTGKTYPGDEQTVTNVRETSC